jgi:hypothetical protein
MQLPKRHRNGMHVLTASVSEPDPRAPKPAHVGRPRSGSLTLAVRT